MYSSMHWVGVYVSQHALGRGVFAQGVSAGVGVSTQEVSAWGVCLGGVCPGGMCLPRGVSAWGTVITDPPKNIIYPSGT